MGRPTTITDDVQKRFVKELSRGAWRETAAQTCGVKLRAVQRFIASKTDEANEFRRKCEEAEAGVENAVLGVQLTAALKGDLQAGRWYLAVKWPEKYGQQRELLREVKRIIDRLEKERATLRREVLRIRREHGSPVGAADD